MERFVRGDVVILPFPFSDLSHAKKRPALVLSPLDNEDIILCPITSTKHRDKYNIDLALEHFRSGTLQKASSIRPHRLFTADKKIIQYKIGSLKKEKITEVQSKVVMLFTE